MASLNKASISGNLTRDAELRVTPNGTAVLELGVAVNEKRKNKQTGEYEDYPSFLDCVMYGKRAEALAQYLPKGTKVAVEGRLHQDRWEDKESGQNRSKVVIVVDEIDFMSTRRGEAQQPQGAPAPYADEDIDF